MPAVLNMRAREGILHVRPEHAFDEAVAEELRGMLSCIPLSVPIILELVEGGVRDTSEIGIVMSFARVASTMGHTLGITIDDNARAWLTGVGVDRMAVMAGSTEECERRMATIDIR